MQGHWLYGVDIFDEIDRLQVIVELPGVSKEDISVNVKANALKNCRTGRCPAISQAHRSGYPGHS